MSSSIHALIHCAIFREGADYSEPPEGAAIYDDVAGAIHNDSVRLYHPGSGEIIDHHDPCTLAHPFINNNKLSTNLFAITGVTEIDEGSDDNDWLYEHFSNGDWEEFTPEIMHLLYLRALELLPKNRNHEFHLCFRLLASFDVSESRDWESGIVDDIDVSYAGPASFQPS